VNRKADTEVARGHATSAGTILHAFAAAEEAITQIGEQRIELVTLTSGRVSIQPVNLHDGEDIARSLGLTLPIDHRMFIPGHTVWSGDLFGLEVQVRAALRQPIGALL
jgi:hypothetical protein